MTPTCPKTKKRVYENEEQATVLANFLPARSPNNRNVTTLRAYQCQFCGGWHLTHKPKREGSKFLRTPQANNREAEDNLKMEPVFVRRDS